MTQALPDLSISVEVVGCPTVCLHCWAMGHAYQAMPLEEISWVLHEVRRFCMAHQLSFDGYPMHEVLAQLDALPVDDLVRWGWREEVHPEAWWREQALSGTWPPEPGKSEYRLIWLVCRPNLDVYRGDAGQYCKFYGNLRRDGVDEVLNRAVADGACSHEELWFTQEQLLPVQEVAARFGDQQSQRIHDAESVRHWWLDCARRAGPMNSLISLPQKIRADN